MGDEPHAISAVWRIDGTSRNKIRLNLVACILQISAHLLEYHSLRPINDAENIFAHDPTRGNLSNCSQHLRPEVAVIVSSFALACEAERLAGESSREDIHPPPMNGKVCCFDIAVLNCGGKMIAQHLFTKIVNLAVEDICPSCPLGGEVETTNAREK